jgi:hypothetical protein
MPIERDKTIKPYLVDAPSIRRRRRSAIEHETLKAENRLAVARLAAETPGTLAVKHLAVCAAARAGLLPLPVAPGETTVFNLCTRYRNGEVTADDYRGDRRPRGPSARRFPAALLDIIEDRAQRHGTGDLEQIAQLARDDAKASGIDASWLTVWHLRRALACIGRHTIVAGRQGSRATEMDALPRETYPTRHTHDLWLLDEGDSDYWCRAVCRVTDQWVSVRPSIILIRDHKSGAVLVGLVVDPTRRIEVETNRSMTSGFDSDDVLTALLAAASPDAAREVTKELAGRLPKKLRWDNASAHQLLERLLFEKGRLKRVDARDPELGVEDDPLFDDEGWAEPEDTRTQLSGIGVRRPDKNGGVERIMSPAKRWLVGLIDDCHVDEADPEDRVLPPLDRGRDRSEISASDNGRPTRRITVPVMSLPTIEDLQAALDEVVDRYNNHLLKRVGMTPLAAARKFMPRGGLRRGVDLIRLLGARDFTVQREGIVVERDRHRVAFEAANQGVLLDVGRTAYAYVHPLLQGLWLEQGAYLAFALPKEERAARRDARTVAMMARLRARLASDDAERSRQAQLSERLASMSPPAVPDGPPVVSEVHADGNGVAPPNGTAPRPLVNAVRESPTTDVVGPPLIEATETSSEPQIPKPTTRDLPVFDPLSLLPEELHRPDTTSGVRFTFDDDPLLP